LQNQVPAVASQDRWRMPNQLPLPVVLSLKTLMLHRGQVLVLEAMPRLQLQVVAEPRLQEGLMVV